MAIKKWTQFQNTKTF